MEATKPRKDTSWLTPYLRALEITRVPEAQRSWSIRSVEQFALISQGKTATCVDQGGRGILHRVPPICARRRRVESPESLRLAEITADRSVWQEMGKVRRCTRGEHGRSEP